MVVRLLALLSVAALGRSSGTFYVADSGGEGSCDAEQDACTDQPGEIPAMMRRLRAADVVEDRDSILGEAEALVKSKNVMKMSAAGNIYLHLLEHNASDVTAWGRHRDVIDKISNRINLGAPTIEYDPSSVVLDESRKQMSKLSSKESITVDEREMVVKKVEWDKRASVFLVDNFISEQEAKRLTRIHDLNVMTDFAMSPTFCDGTGGDLFRKRIESDFPASKALKTEEFRRKYFVGGYNCLLHPNEHSWVATLDWSKETVYYPADYQLIDMINSRIHKLTKIPEFTGYPTTMIAYGPGQGAENGTGCETGAKYSPRKLNAASVQLVLSAAKSGGEEVYARKDIKAKVPVGFGQLLVTFHFDGQECDLRTTYKTTPVRSGRKVVLSRAFDNIQDQALGLRSLQHLTLDIVTTDEGPQKVPYSPTVLCGKKFCVEQFNANNAMQHAFNDEDVSSWADVEYDSEQLMKDRYWESGGKPPKPDQEQEHEQNEVAEEEWGY